MEQPRITSTALQIESNRARYHVAVPCDGTEVKLLVYVDRLGKLVDIEPSSADDIPYVKRAAIRHSVWWVVSRHWQRVFGRVA